MTNTNNYNALFDELDKLVKDISKEFESFKIDDNSIAASASDSDAIVGNFRCMTASLVNKCNKITNHCYDKAKRICDEADITNKHSYDDLELLNPVETDTVYVRLKERLDRDFDTYRDILDNDSVRRVIITISLEGARLKLEYTYIDSARKAIYPKLHKLKKS